MYCNTDFSTLNNYCKYLYSYFQTDSQIGPKKNVTLVFENTASFNLTLNYIDYFGNEKF